MPGLHLYRSNHLPFLADLLARSIAAEPLEDPLAPEWVVLGNKGLEAWLVRSFAQHHRVCANVEFPFATSFIARVLASFEAVERGEPRRFTDPPPGEVWTPDALTWAILELLPEQLAAPDPGGRFEPVRRWVAAGPACEADAPTRRRYALARRIADVFDRLLVFRPDLAQAWSAGAAAGDLPADLRWQPVLWKAVTDRLGDAPHLAQRLQRLPELLRGPRPPGLPQRLSVFGLSTLPPAMLQALASLGQVAQVDLYLLNASAHLWERIDAAARQQLDEPAVPNRLLASFGRLARDFQHQLLDLSGAVDDRTAFVERELWFDPAAARPGRALSALQSDVVHLRGERHRRPLARVDGGGALVAIDDSVQIHACHGLTRQVEVLRDALLGLLEDDRTLQPRDILVLCPQMDAAAPLITAVFEQGGGPGAPPRLPYRIEDLSFRRTNPVAAALLQVLALVDGRLEASAVLDLLQLEPVQTAFGISAAEVPTVAALFEDAGIRWGADGAWRARFGQPADDRNTWRFGLDRLALGVAVADDWHLWAGAVPLDDVEGSRTALVGRALAFATAVLDEVARLREPRTVADWMAALLGSDSEPGTLARLTRAPENAAWLVERTRRELQDVAAQAEAARSSLPVGLPTIRSHLEGRFEVVAPNPRTPGGAVAFAALRPMRAVPHRVVVLLGMDDGVFPSTDKDLRFDPCARAPRPGDRDPRDEDRAAFLEAILSAEQHLLVFYAGRDPRTDEARPPCGPVAELMDVLDRSFEPVEVRGRRRSPAALLSRTHPLQSYSPECFEPRHPPGLDGRGGRRAWSFDAELARAVANRVPAGAGAGMLLPAGLTLPAPQGEEADGGQPLPLARLARFWRDPVRWLSENRLGLRAEDEEGATVDREPLELDGLQGWQLSRALLDAHDDGVSAPVAAAVLQGRGALPLGAPARAVLRDHQARVDAAIAEEERLAAGREAQPVPLDLVIDGQALVGHIPEARQASWGQYSILRVVGSLRLEKLLSAWVHLLAWTVVADGGRVVVRVVSVGRAPDVWALALPEADDAERLDAAQGALTWLLAGHRRGTLQPLPLFKKTSAAFAEAVDGAGGTADDLDTDPKLLGLAVRAAEEAWSGGHDRTGEGAEPALVRLFGPPDARWSRRPWLDAADDLDRDFAAAALGLWAPVLAAKAAGEAFISEPVADGGGAP